MFYADIVQLWNEVAKCGNAILYLLNKQSLFFRHQYIKKKSRALIQTLPSTHSQKVHQFTNSNRSEIKIATFRMKFDTVLKAKQLIINCIVGRAITLQSLKKKSHVWAKVWMDQAHQLFDIMICFKFPA